MVKDLFFKLSLNLILVISAGFLGSLSARAAEPSSAIQDPSSPQVQVSTAGGVTGGSVAKNPWYDPNDPMCKQGCTYDKANEGLLLLAKYTATKYEDVKQAMNSANPNQKDEALKAMGDFCRNTTDPTNCWPRYSRYTLLYLNQIRLRVTENETAHAQLNSKRVEKGPGAKTWGDDIPEIETKKPEGYSPKPKLPNFPTYNELIVIRKEQIKTQNRMSAGITPQFAEWLKSYPTSPSEDDFVRTKEILRDPGRPEAGTFTVVMTGPDGKIVRDKAKFALAKKAYDEEAKRFNLEDGEKLLTDDRDKMAQSFKTVPPKLKPADPINLDSISKTSFIENRFELVDEINSDTNVKNKGKGKALKNASSGSNRVPTSQSVQHTGNELIIPPKQQNPNETIDRSSSLDNADAEGYIIRAMREDVGGEPSQPVIPPDDH
ncbi:hypothetical protein WDW37_10885 [Bdellovibrionota bacterium FG-1]